jgi:hypothetical protein
MLQMRNTARSEPRHNPDNRLLTAGDRTFPIVRPSEPRFAAATATFALSLCKFGASTIDKRPSRLYHGGLAARGAGATPPARFCIGLSYMGGRPIHCCRGVELGEGGGGKRPILGGRPRSGSAAAARRHGRRHEEHRQEGEGDGLRGVSGGIPRFGGTCWRVTGPSLDEITTSIGVEVYVDHLGKRLVIATVF